VIIEEQEKVLNNDKKRMLVSASAGSGKTFVVIKYLTKLICEKKVPVKDFVVLTFTKAAANEMKERLQKSLKELGDDPFIVEQLDALSIANISTIHAYCEKMLKKYANLLGLNSNFSIADENQAFKIGQEAFANALTEFEKSNQDEYLRLMHFYKNGKGQIKKILMELENLVCAVADKDAFLKANLDHPEEFFDKAMEFLFESTKQEISLRFAEVQSFHVDDFEFSLENALSPLLVSKDIFDMSRCIENFKFPFLPKKKDVGDEVVESLNKIKKNLKKAMDVITELNLTDEDNVSGQRFACLENLLLKLFEVFERENRKLKSMKNVLSFDDLESFMLKLSETENLFDGIKYVFVDEYQDTNKIQERIVKNIAKNSNFVAVGDVKQGIYGFRLASCEIFLRDMKEFDEDDSSSLNSLKSNFRSSQKVLNFVNDVFKVCMTEKSAGIDYESTSMLDGKGVFEEENAKAINIDIVKEEVLTHEKLPEVYSVRDDALIFEQSNRRQLLAVKQRILQVLKSEIFENGTYRRCKLSDIAILFRSRSGGLFDELEQFLLENGIPVISNSRNGLFDQPLMQVLLNWLKLSLVFNDDVAMLSVLKSPLVGLSLDEIALIAKDDQRSLCEMAESGDARFEKFNCLMKDFRMDMQFFGIKNAFCKLFDKTNFGAYINSLPNQQKLNGFVAKFLGVIESGEFEYDVAGLINFFESVEIPVVSETVAVEDAVLLTTIHNSKGLEYPIVFLCGCDRSLKGASKNGLVEINEYFGFAVKKYDTEKNQEIVSARMRAISQSEKKKDFIEELMIFYVALTRAKNRLYLFGRYNENMFKRFSVFDCDSYFELIFFAKQELKESLLQSDCFEDEDMQVRVIDEIEEKSLEKIRKESVAGCDEALANKLKDFLDFEYKIDDKMNFKLKESVTSLNKRQLEDLTEHFSNDNFHFGGNFVEEGNAYHLALKILDFEEVESLADVEKQFAFKHDLLGEIEKLVDKRILLKNILLLKEFANDSKVFKEKQFIMKESLSNLLEQTNADDKILVQGIIDFYAIKNNKIILIDYKYSQSNNDEYLINKYKNQLKLYKIALENGLNMEVEKTYLLSLKNAKIIKIDL